MKDSNKIFLAKCINDVLNSEFEEMKLENDKLKTKISEKDLEIKELKNKVQKSESISYEYANYKTFYHTHFGVCPQCNGAGGWQDGYGNGGQCDFCMGKGEIEHESIRALVLSQIQNSLKSTS